MWASSSLHVQHLYIIYVYVELHFYIVYEDLHYILRYRLYFHVLPNMCCWWQSLNMNLRTCDWNALRCKILRLPFLFKVTLAQVVGMQHFTGVWILYSAFESSSQFLYSWQRAKFMNTMFLASWFLYLSLVRMRVYQTHTSEFKVRQAEISFNSCSFLIRQSTWKELRYTSRSLKLMPLMLNLLETKFLETSCKSTGLLYPTEQVLCCYAATYWGVSHHII